MKHLLFVPILIQASSHVSAATTLLIDDFVASENRNTIADPGGANSSFSLFQGNPVGDTRYVTITNSSDAVTRISFASAVVLSPVAGVLTSLSTQATRYPTGTYSWEINYFGPLAFGPGVPRPTGFNHRPLDLDLSSFSFVQTEWFGDRENAFLLLGINPSDPVQRRLQGPPTKSKFLAVSQ